MMIPRTVTEDIRPIDTSSQYRSLSSSVSSTAQRTTNRASLKAKQAIISQVQCFNYNKVSLSKKRCLWSKTHSIWSKKNCRWIGKAAKNQRAEENGTKAAFNEGRIIDRGVDSGGRVGGRNQYKTEVFNECVLYTCNPMWLTYVVNH